MNKRVCAKTIVGVCKALGRALGSRYGVEEWPGDSKGDFDSVSLTLSMLHTSEIEHSKTRFKPFIQQTRSSVS